MSTTMDLLAKLRAVLLRAEEFGDEGERPFDTVIDEVLDPCEVVISGRPTLMFGSNNYFGLTFHPAVIAATKAAVDRYGTGTTGSRVANGTLAIHQALEQEFARLFGKRQAVVFTTGYQASLSTIGALCGFEDFALLDADCHASIYDGARLSGATVVGFRHNCPDSLRKQLTRLPGGDRNRLVVVEGLYSIRGDLAPLAEIVLACQEAGAYLLVDEAHSFGAYGTRGLGCAEAQGVLGDVDFVIGTFSKALAGIGGFAISDHPELKGLHFLARPYVFTASGSPATIAGVHAALTILGCERSLVDRLWRAVHRLRAGLDALGYRIGATASPIIPVLVGDRARTISIWRALLEAGLYVNIVLPPGCPADECLLRMSCSAAHTDSHVDRALEILGRVGRNPGVIKLPA